MTRDASLARWRRVVEATRCVSYGFHTLRRCVSGRRAWCRPGRLLAPRGRQPSRTGPGLGRPRPAPARQRRLTRSAPFGSDKYLNRGKGREIGREPLPGRREAAGGRFTAPFSAAVAACRALSAPRPPRHPALYRFTGHPRSQVVCKRRASYVVILTRFRKITGAVELPKYLKSTKPLRLTVGFIQTTRIYSHTFYAHIIFRSGK